jgi:cyclomaltodextrinase
MILEAVYHRPKLNWAYAYDPETLHIRIRTKRDDVDLVTLVHGDKYNWDKYEQKTVMRKYASDAMFDYWQTEVKPPFRRMRYYFTLEAHQEIYYFTERGFSQEAPENPNTNFDFPFINPVDVFTPPAWVKDAVFYQIFPERFGNSDPSLNPEGTLPWGEEPAQDNFFGGDLQGVIDHLDYLEALGVNALYFTPLFAATTNHKYDTSDYMNVDPQFGTNETLKQLVDACHERGIRVLLDAVFNHSGRTFAPFLDCLAHGKDSKYADWFHVREWPLQVKDGIPTYNTFAFEPHMPKLNTENAEVKAYLLDVARYWIEEIGIDGWRLDVANEVDHEFWRAFRKVVKAANPDAYILGEIWHESIMWLQGDQFDAVMNYPVTNAAIDFFAKESISARQFIEEIGTILSNYPQQVHEVAFNLLDSHDTPRLLTMCNEDKNKFKMAAAFQLTYPGVPCIYYGDEIGLTGEQDPGCRKCMEWDASKQDQDLFFFYQRMIALRKHHQALRTGSLTFLHADQDDRTLIYERKTEAEHLIIIMNPKNELHVLYTDIPTGFWKDIWNDEEIHVREDATAFELDAYEFIILKKL